MDCLIWRSQRDNINSSALKWGSLNSPVLVMALSQPFSVTVHPFSSPTGSQSYSCAYERGNASCRNALVYIGGLTSGPHTALALPQTLLSVLDDAGSQYSIWECRMRSSYTGWGYSSLKHDVEDIAALVRYLRGIRKNKVVLLGSSTGKVHLASQYSLTILTIWTPSPHKQPSLISVKRLPRLYGIHERARENRTQR